METQDSIILDPLSELKSCEQKVPKHECSRYKREPNV